MVDEVKAFLNAQLSKAAPTLKDVTQSTQSFVSDALASIYGVAASGATKLTSLDPKQRLGIFTLPGRDHLALGARHHAPREARRVLHAQGDVHAARPAAGRRQHGDPRHRDRHGTPEGRERDPDGRVPGLPPGHQPVRLHAGELRSARPVAHAGQRAADRRRASRSTSSTRGRSPPATRSTRCKGFTDSLRFKQCFVRQMFRFYTGRDETAADDPVLRQMFFGFANNDEQAVVQLLRVLATLDQLLAAIGDAMTRRTLKEGTHPPRSDQALRLRGVPADAGGARDGLPRRRNVRRGAALPDVLQGRVVLSGLDEPVRRSAAWRGRRSRRCSRTASDIILFKSMNIHGGSPKTDGYQEEHAAGLIGCTTGNSYHYSKNDSYYAYTDFESIDVAIANHYAATPATAKLPFSSLHIGAGAHSDADSVGLGQRYISWRARQAGDAQYGNAIEPIQDAGQVYDMLMERVNLLCSGSSNQPATDTTQGARGAGAQEEPDRLPPRRHRRGEAGAGHGLGARPPAGRPGRRLARGREGQQRGDRRRWTRGRPAGGGGSTAACPTGARPTGNGTKKLNCDDLSPIHDQMIGLVKLAFEWDLTRVVAYTLSGASSGQSMPSRSVTKAHHTLEHSNDVNGLNTMGNVLRGEVRGPAGRAEGHQRRKRPDRALQQRRDPRDGMLEQQLQRPLPDRHPVHPGRAGRGQVPDRPHRRRRQAQQQRPARSPSRTPAASPRAPSGWRASARARSSETRD